MTRDARILLLYRRNLTRKDIAYRVHSSYDTVKKVIQKYVGPERRARERIIVSRRGIVVAIN